MAEQVETMLQRSGDQQSCHVDRQEWVDTNELSKLCVEQSPCAEVAQIWSQPDRSNSNSTDMRQSTVYNLNEYDFELNLLPEHNIFSTIKARQISETQRPQSQQNHIKASRSTQNHGFEQKSFVKTTLSEERNNTRQMYPNIQPGQLEAQDKYVPEASDEDNHRLSSSMEHQGEDLSRSHEGNVATKTIAAFEEDNRSPSKDFEQEQVSISMDGTTQLESRESPATLEKHLHIRDVDQIPQGLITTSVQPSPTGLDSLSSLMSEQPHSQSALIRSSHQKQNRVTKPQHRSVTQISRFGRQKVVLSQVPSEQDLILLLMRRHRRSAQSYSVLLKAYHDIEAENAKLCSTRNATETELQQAQQQWQILMQENHVQEADLRKFKDKYSKLKQWLQAIGEDVKLLQRDRDTYCRDIATLRSDAIREAMVSQELLETCEASVGKISGIKESISKLKAETVMAEALQNQLHSERQRIREEKLQNKTHALYIERLERSQHSLQANFSKKQDEMTVELTNVAVAMQKNHQNLAREIVVPLLEGIEATCKQYAGELISSCDFREGMAKLENNCHGLEALLRNMHTAQMEGCSASSSQDARATEALNNLTSEFQNVRSLEKENATFVEMTKHIRETLRSTQREKQHLQLLTTGLMEVHKQAIAGITSTSNETDKSAHLNEEINRQRALVHSREKEIFELTKGLADVQRASDSTGNELSKLQKQHQEQLAELSLKHRDELEEKGRIMKTELDLKDQQMAKCAIELEERQQQSSLFQSELTKLEQTTTHLRHQIKKLTDEASCKDEQIIQAESIKADLHEQQKREQTLEQEKRALELQVEDLKAVQTDLNQATCDKSVLQDSLEEAMCKVSELEQNMVEVENWTDALTIATKEIQQLKGKLSENAHVHADMITLQQSHDLLCQQHQELAAELSTSKQEAARVTELEQDIDKYQQRIEKLSLSLETAQKELAHVDSLQNKLQISQENNIRMVEELKTCRSQIDELGQYKSQMQEKTETIDNLQQHLSELSTLKLRMERLVEESQQKETESALLHERIKTLEVQSRPFDIFHKHFTHEEIATMNEDIVLSLKSILHQSQLQQVGSEDSDDETDINEANMKPHGVVTGKTLDIENDIVVPDSQSQGEINHQVDAVRNSSPGPFTEPVDPMLKAGNTTRKSVESFFDHHEYNIPTVSEYHHGRNVRPGTSNDEMLLRSSDNSNFSPGSQQDLVRDTNVEVPTSSQGLSPMKTRGGSQIRHFTPAPRGLTDSQSPGNYTHPREPAAPNSAAKRRANQEPDSTPKRARASNLNLERNPSRSTTPKSARFALQHTVHNPPTSARKGGSVLGSTAPAPGKNKKRSNTTRKSSKDAAYASQFGSKA